MKELRPITLEPITISIEPKTSLLVLKQGESEIKVTRTQVIGLRKLQNGEIEGGVYTSAILPRNQFRKTDDTIVATCDTNDEKHTVVIKKHRKTDDLQRIFDYVEKHRGKIAWDNDFRGRRR